MLVGAGRKIYDSVAGIDQVRRPAAVAAIAQPVGRECR